MRRRRNVEGMNLAFLDIMACGLGAIILVFMLVKKNVDDGPVEIEQLQRDISQLEQAQSTALNTLSEVREKLAQENIRLESLGRSVAQRQSTLAQQQSDMRSAQTQLEQLKSSITEIEIPDRQDLIETQQVNEEHYLMGLRVEGRRIAILLDKSASMTHEKLIDIIRTKSSSNAVKQSAEKWQRTRQTLQWLLARVPQNSEVLVIAFSEEAEQLGSGNGWQAASEANINGIIRAANGLIPDGGTNLQKALNKANQFSPTNLYVITDGLPTKGESQYRSLNPFSSCRSLTGNAQTISGECRVRLFQQTIQESGRGNMKVDVILLPLEGDPAAINQYWGWAAGRGGLVISPASDWP